MLLTITTTHQPATDLGFLLHKNPSRAQSKELPFGMAHVFYPQADTHRCTAALLVEIDTVGIVRRDNGPAGDGFALQQYVNDRPFVASSFLSVAMRIMLGTAIAGNCKSHPQLADTPIPLTATVHVVAARNGGADLLRGLFEPLGYTVNATGVLLDERFPEWGESPYFTLTISQTIRLSDLLSHLYVLIPVLDNDKHYWIGEEEVQKLLRHGDVWLKSHPLKQLIVDRYLQRRRKLTRLATESLLEEDLQNVDEQAEANAAEEEQVEKTLTLNQQRLDAVMREILASGAKRVLDLGCSTGNLLRRLIAEPSIERIVGYDVSHAALTVAAKRINLDRLRERDRERVELLQGSLTYRDQRLEGFDAAAVVEVIEHLDAPRLESVERALFERARPGTIVLTTPNREFNAQWPTLPAGKFRHRDHRFEWTRAEFQAWATAVAERYGYTVRFEPVGPVVEDCGSPTQMGVFVRAGGGAE